jgi:glyoxylase-like metal-dependent hydrolase (beta-lactamase superfamily II)
VSDWQIKALIRGEINGDRSINMQYVGMGEKYWHPSTVYYLTDGDRNILIDTGFGDPEEAAAEQPLFDVRTDRSLSALLEEEAVPPAEIDTLVMSHLHWDHAGDVDLLADSGAEVLINREALRFASAPPEPYGGAYRSPAHGYDPSWSDVEFTFFDGDTEIAPGLRAIHTPGHSPGHVSFLVESGETTYGLAIDVFPNYANIEGTDASRYHPPGCVNALDWWESAKTLDERADELVPSHDPDGPANELITEGDA